MKIELDERIIRIVPESFADKLYIKTFVKSASEDSADKNLSISFSYSEDRLMESAPKGGGWADQSQIVETLYEAEENQDKGYIAVKEIDYLEILAFEN